MAQVWKRVLPATLLSGFDRGCVKTPTARVFGSCKMSPEVPIVDCGPFCAVGYLRTIDKSEFSHSLDPKLTFNRSNPAPLILRDESLDQGITRVRPGSGAVS